MNRSSKLIGVKENVCISIIKILEKSCFHVDPFGFLAQENAISASLSQLNRIVNLKLRPERILSLYANFDGQFVMLVKWQGCPACERVPFELMRSMFPEELLQYYRRFGRSF